eukprot:SAG11_NODE_1413_length_4981_cov_2.208726_6_plen_223_part_00
MLTESRIWATGIEYHGTPGVLIGYTSDTEISYTEISHLSYTGVSQGWGWGQKSYARRNSVHHCHIHDVMCGELVDGGSLYSLGPQPGSTWHDNYIHNQCEYSGLLYHDSGSSGSNDYRNVLAASRFRGTDTGWWLLINGNGANDSVNDCYVDWSCNHTDAACETGLCTVGNITFVKNYAAFPVVAKQIIGHAGPTRARFFREPIGAASSGKGGLPAVPKIAA